MTLTINGSKYNFYNSSDYPGMSLITPSGRSTSENTLLSSIASRIVSAYGGDTLVSCKVEGNAITVTSLVADKVMDFKQGIVVGPETELGFGKNGLTLGKDFVQKSQVELTLPPSDQYSTLDGSGFFLGSIPFEFTTDEKTGAETRKIDIRSCANIEDVKNAVAGQLPSGYRAKVDGDKLIIERNSSFTFVDGKSGADGLFDNAEGKTEVIAANGTTVTKPHATINFSRYNSENFDELYGKGFRVTCATCDNEFINVIFCNDKTQAQFDESFPLLDENRNPVTDQDGNPIEIQNCVVELKNMNSGTDIVRSIVDQLSSRLDHFTEMAVGTPDSVLVVRDKRVGDIAGRKAKIIPGVYTNYTYDLTIIKHENPEAFIGGPDTNTTANFGYCAIYAGDSEGKPEWIGVRLPNLSLKKLNLDPPRPDLTDVDSIEDVRKRLRIADDVIGLARGALGADQNRLDHAKGNLSVAAEQTADTYSRIRDLDMAEGVTEQVKLSILQQSQKSALAHINQQASEVLKLMQ